MKTKTLLLSLALGLTLTFLVLIQIQAAQPIANDDAYTTSAYVPLSIAAPGVLENDSDTDGDILTATLNTAPSHGTLVLDGDGAFVYTPTVGFYGVDTFTYWPDDGSTFFPVAYWPFDEGSGTTTGDLTGKGHDGTLINGPTFATTVPTTPTFANPYAISFDGVDDVIAIPSSDDINLGTHALRTVCAWFNVQDKAISTTKQVIWEEGGSTSGLNIYVYDGALYGGAWSNDTGWSGAWLSSTAILSNHWHHVALVLDGSTSNTLDLYLDGQPVANGAGQAIGNHNNAIGIGQAQGSTRFHDTTSSGDGHAFGGLIDDVRVYNHALSTAVVQDVMNASQSPLSILATVTLTVNEVPSTTLDGTVTDSATGAPLEGADVEAVHNALASYADTTDAAGGYGWTVPTFSYTVTAQMDYGYYSKTIADVVVAGATTLDIALDPIPTYVVSGTVTDATVGWPLYARIDIDGYPGGPVWTDPLSGSYSVTLASETPYTFAVSAWVDGYTSASRAVGPLTGDVVENFALNVDNSCTAPGYTTNAFFEDGFESGDLIAGGWIITTTAEGRVRVDTYDPHAGDYSVLLDSAVDGTYSLAGIILPIDLSAELQVYLDFWWHEYGDENDAEDGVFLSDDGGSTWCPIFSFNNGPSDYINTQIDLTAEAGTCGLSLGADTRILFQFYDNFTVPTDGYTIDQVRLSAESLSCIPLPGRGLVAGHVYDENTGDPVNGATVADASGNTTTSISTPGDAAVEDGLYILATPAGTGVLTATMSNYEADVDTVSVPVSNTVGHDFYLSAGLIDLAPDGHAVTLDMGLTTTLPITLSNTGGVPALFEMTEASRGFDSASLGAGTIEWLYRSTTGIQASEAGSADSGATLRYPGAYRYIPAYLDASTFSASSSTNILVYTDDWIHIAPDTLVQQALSNLGLPATVHVDGDYAGFLDNLNNGGPWDLVVWSGENTGVDSYVLSDLLAYLQGGGRLVATYWRQLEYPDHPLWAEMGFEYISNYITPPPAYWWEPGHPLFNAPMQAPEWINRVQNSGTSQGTRLEPLGNGTALAGYTTPGPDANEAAIVLRDDGKALYKGIRDVSTNADENGNGILDGTELWMNILNNMVYGFEDVPWLEESPVTGTLTAPGSQVVDVTFDAGAVSQPGTYYATLYVSSTTPYPQPWIPVTMTVNTPTAWGQVNGTLTTLGYCDTNPAPLPYRDILIEDNTGAVYTATTDSSGEYQWWIDAQASPLTVTTAVPGYETATVTGVVVTAGASTTVDFDLRMLAPCVSVEPEYYEQVVALGDSVSDILELTNSGALSTTFELVETPALDWLSETPVTGTVNADGLQTIELLFDSASLPQTGLYSGELRVLTDDPSAGTIVIPVDLWVVSGATGVKLGPSAVLTGLVGTAVTHTLTLTNSGTVTDVFDLAPTGNTWPTALPDDTGYLVPGEVLTFDVVVTIPVDAADGNSDMVDITAISRLDDSVTDSATLTTRARYRRIYLPFVAK